MDNRQARRLSILETLRLDAEIPLVVEVDDGVHYYAVALRQPSMREDVLKLAVYPIVGTAIFGRSAPVNVKLVERPDRSLVDPAHGTAQGHTRELWVMEPTEKELETCIRILRKQGAYDEEL